MKKLKIFSLILIAVLSISMFTGCLFSDNASIKECYDKYESIAKTYSSNTKNTIKIKANSEEYSLSEISIKFDNSDGLGTYISNSNRYSLLNSELQSLLNGSLLYFYNYKNHLTMSENEKNIPQKDVSKIYVALDNMDSKLKALTKSKKELETYWNSSHQDDAEDSIIGQMFTNCVNDYFNVINSALEVSANTKNAVNSLLGSEGVKTNTKNAVLAINLSSTKILANYYQQYIEYNGAKAITQTGAKLLNYYNRVVLSNQKVLEIGSNFASTTQEQTQEVVKCVKDLEIMANEMYGVNKKLDGKTYTLEEDANKYYLQQIYNIILDKSIVNNALDKAIVCF